jgi:hypothetical protein
MALLATGQQHQPLDDAAVLTAEVDRLDELAWDIQERVELGEASEEAYEVAFCRARSVNAALLAFHDGDSSDAVYEALIALPEGTGDTAILSD